MNSDTAATIASQLNITYNQVNAVLQLLHEDGATVPFIARYRKERTNGLDEVAIAHIRDAYQKEEAFQKRKTFILGTLEEQGLLSEELASKIQTATDSVVLEDLYLPFKSKKVTRATKAKNKGLEPLAKIIMSQPAQDAESLAERYVNPGKEVKDPKEALQGARDIIAEWVSEHANNRQIIRRQFQQQAQIEAKVVKAKKEEADKYRDYFDWSESLKRAPSHRLLAILRGADEGLLKFKVVVTDDSGVDKIKGFVLRGNNSCSEQVNLAIDDACKRLIFPAIANEVLQEAKAKAEEKAIEVFAGNVRQLMMEAPLGEKRLLAIDPGFRTGCKMVCLDAQGKLLNNETIYPHTGGAKQKEASKKVFNKIESYKVEAIAVGNGTAGRETEAFLKQIRVPKDIPVISVNESGASVYSASKLAREEFPEYDVTVRGAVSIGRRLMDPLAELVKIDPKAIGVGQYQHDVDQGKLKHKLDDVVLSCVNAVGVELNTASKELLTHVSGLGPGLAQNIVTYRDENGAFQQKSDLKKVPRLGNKAFEQAAGFLRIKNGKNPLDESAVHPENYDLVKKMAQSVGVSVKELVGNKDVLSQMDVTPFVSGEVGEPTLKDIIKELSKPGRDPRPPFKTTHFTEGVNSMDDLREGMVLPGVVSNITAFGCFVDIGVHQDGLVHVSELANQFVKDPNEIVTLRQNVTVKVLQIDKVRKRLALSMKQV